MSKNILKEMENDDTNFFVMKSIVSAKFETESYVSKYHIFYIKPNSNPDAYHEGYMNLKVRKMNKKEIEYFNSNIDNYFKDNRYEGKHNPEDGCIFNLKSKPFDKTQTKTYRQYILSL